MSFRHRAFSARWPLHRRKPRVAATRAPITLTALALTTLTVLGLTALTVLAPAAWVAFDLWPVPGADRARAATSETAPSPPPSPPTGGSSSETAPVKEPGPVAPVPFPSRYGPDPDRCFSPLRVPAEAMPAVGEAGAGADTGGAGDGGGSGGVEGGAVGGDDGGAEDLAEPKKLVYLVLNVAARRLYVYEGGTLTRVISTAVGVLDHHTPIGDFAILSKFVYPTWRPPDGSPPVPPGPDNPLGSRWLGFSWRGYGLHGTNATWSIGRVISMGCVRMRNEDIEWLFDRVRVGTPLRAVYEPVEMTVYPAAGGFVLTLYPDIYHRTKGYEEFVASRLALAGVQIPSDLLRWLLDNAPRYDPVTLDTATPAFFGGQRLATDIVRVGRAPADYPRISVRAFGDALGLPVGWDAVTGRATLGGRAVPCIVVAGRAYAGVDELAAALGTHLEWTWEVAPPAAGTDLVRQRLTIYSGLVYVNGRLVSMQAFRRPDGIYLPLRAVAEALGMPVLWDPVRHVAIVGGAEVPVVLVEGTSFVRSDVLAALLGERVTVAVTPDGILISR